MKLHVTGVETVEVTDPKGICNPVMPVPPRGQTPMRTKPFAPSTPDIRQVPAEITVPKKYEIDLPFGIWKKPREHKWQTGFTGDPLGSDPREVGDVKWTRNMQLGTAGKTLFSGETAEVQTNGIDRKTYSS